MSGQWAEAVAGFEAAVGLVGLVAPRSLTRSDQEQLLTRLGGLASDAAACCVRVGLPDRAVELLEQGRGVLLSQALDTRTDLTDLTAQHPGLADRFTRLRSDLDQPSQYDRNLAWPAADRAAGGDVSVARAELERRRELAADFDAVITEIRAQPGFERFLRQPLIGDLAAAADGPVVIVNVSRFGSHALILTTRGVLEPVPLNDLTPQAVKVQVDGFLAALHGIDSSAAAQGPLIELLGWLLTGVLERLWDTVAGPVLDRLGITGPPPDGAPWTRLWWCVPGLLSFLPLHAAGHHQTRASAAPQTVIDRVISSYTPTIRALLHARRTHPPDTGVPAGGGRDRLIVAMPHTPGRPDLPGALAEARLLRHHFGDQAVTLTGPQATYDTVTAALPAARWAHFACHGHADLASPSASALLLYDHQDRPLTVTDVARLRLDHAALAFLSACSTSSPGERLPDEAIHLASAFQLAGYQHVIATLWPVSDYHATQLADGLYTALASTGTARTAAALHEVTRQLRDRRQPMPWLWAAHIHAGP